jgi:hypothetical protein
MMYGSFPIGKRTLSFNPWIEPRLLRPDPQERCKYTQDTNKERDEDSGSSSHAHMPVECSSIERKHEGELEPKLRL